MKSAVKTKRDSGIHTVIHTVNAVNTSAAKINEAVTNVNAKIRNILKNKVPRESIEWTRFDEPMEMKYELWITAQWQKAEHTGSTKYLAIQWTIQIQGIDAAIFMLTELTADSTTKRIQIEMSTGSYNGPNHNWTEKGCHRIHTTENTWADKATATSRRDAIVEHCNDRHHGSYYLDRAPRNDKITIDGRTELIFRKIEPPHPADCVKIPIKITHRKSLDKTPANATKKIKSHKPGRPLPKPAFDPLALPPGVSWAPLRHPIPNPDNPYARRRPLPENTESDQEPGKKLGPTKTKKQSPPKRTPAQIAAQKKRWADYRANPKTKQQRFSEAMAKLRAEKEAKAKRKAEREAARNAKIAAADARKAAKAAARLRKQKQI